MHLAALRMPGISLAVVSTHHFDVYSPALHSCPGIRLPSRSQIMTRWHMEATDMKHKRHYRAKGRRAKRTLRLPALQHPKAAVLNSLTNADAQRCYRHAIDEFVDWYCSEPRLAFNRIVVLRYRSYLESRQLASGTVNLRF